MVESWKSHENYNKNFTFREGFMCKRGPYSRVRSLQSLTFQWAASWGGGSERNLDWIYHPCSLSRLQPPIDVPPHRSTVATSRAQYTWRWQNVPCTIRRKRRCIWEQRKTFFWLFTKLMWPNWLPKAFIEFAIFGSPHIISRYWMNRKKCIEPNILLATGKNVFPCANVQPALHCTCEAATLAPP